MNALAKRLIACKHFRWTPGMRDIAGWRVLSVDGVDGNKYLIACEVDSEDPDGNPQEQGEAIWNIGLAWPPDLTDPGTLGCLLALVREAWDDPLVTTKYWPGPAEWTCYSNKCSALLPGYHLAAQGETEAETLVAALEAAR